MITFYNTFTKGFGNINHIEIMDEVDTFERIVLPIRVSIIYISPDVCT